MEDNKKKGLGMVLEGGGMRGLYTAGVLDELMEQGIYADSTVGVSAGAIFGCNYKSRQIGRTLRYNTRFCKDKRYMGLKSWITTGDLYSKDFAYGEVPWKLDVFDTLAPERTETSRGFSLSPNFFPVTPSILVIASMI